MFQRFGKRAKRQEQLIPRAQLAGHWLYDHPKVRLSAHISWASPKMVDTIVELFVANLRRYAAGEPLEGVVDPVEGY